MKRGFLNTDKARQKLAAEADATPVPQDKGKAKAETSLHENGPMKRGFLNTDRAKQQLAALAPDPSITLKDKGKTKATTTPRDNEPLPYPPLLDLHRVPPSLTAKKDKPKKKRFIFRQWPRDPNGQPILPSDIHGKEAPNGLDFWGATIFDFYFVHRMPEVVNAITISTGSKLAKVMQSFGELEHAKDEISWAAREADPEEIPAWDPVEAVVAHERRVHALPVVDRSTKLPKASSVEPDTDVQMLHASDQPGDSIVSTEDAVEVEDTAATDGMSEPMDVSVDSTVLPTRQPLLNVSIESPFHPTHYPSPWPLAPFESSCSPFLLQRQIPLHLLPKKLYVHDPWGLVETANTYYGDYGDPESLKKQKQESWNSKTDRIHTYSLSIPPELVEVASKSAITAEAEALKGSETIFISPQETEGATEQPAIRVFLPPRPPKLTEVPEGHLYLSPKGRLGEGHHSIVYEVELELPREVFCESTYCRTCLDDEIKVEVDRLKASGEWDRMLNDMAKEFVVTKAPDAASNDTPSSSSVPRYVGFVKEKFEHVPMETMSIAFADGVAAEDDADALAEQLMRVSDSVINRYIQYEGPVIPIHPKIHWQNPSFPDTICEHQAKKLRPVPRTATFRVAAKLSLPYDCHLNREASNYVEFPAHFFQHWSGYNVVPPLHDPTPVGALVPQFFGYYKPADSGQNPNGSFQSPILLIEHCGKPISVDELSLDDRQECAALLYRFHSGGWLHNSFAARNILRQKRHPTCSPLEDEDKCERVAHRHRPYSFRMIDFGRSTQATRSTQCITESMDAKKLFRIMEFTHL